MTCAMIPMLYGLFRSKFTCKSDCCYC